MTSAPLVILTDVTDVDPAAAIALLEGAGCTVRVLDLIATRTVPPSSRDAVAAIVGFARIDDEILRQLPALRVLALTSAGADMVDGAAAEARDITVLPLLGPSTGEVATHALALILALIRDLPHAQQIVREGGWTRDAASIPPATEDLTLGLLGFGRIARETARRSQPLFGRIIAHEPFGPVDDYADAVDLDTLFSTADIVSLHVPSTPATTGIVSSGLIDRMRRGALLVNVSRGDLVDTRAVVAALDDGRLGGYGADVLDGEPPSASHPLRRHRRALVTPHIAYRSDRSMARYASVPAQAVLQFLGSQTITPGPVESP